MDTMVIFSLFGEKTFTQTLSNKLNAPIGSAEIRSFPDEEMYLRILSDISNKDIIINCSMHHPNHKILPLLFMAQTMKELGAKKIWLAAPYLPYMRQDARFQSGEAITSKLFAQLVSSFIDGLVTIDPHLHRIQDLGEIFSIPAVTLHTTKLIAHWIKANVTSPIIIGPDEESKQWVFEVAKEADAPFVILQKVRHGDRRVEISVPDITDNGNTPVLVDDIISTGSSMLSVIQQLREKKFKNPICIGVHALFSNEVYTALMQAGAQQIISCNTILHPSNKIDVSELIAAGIKSLCTNEII